MTNFNHIDSGIDHQLKYFGAFGAGIIALKRFEVVTVYGAPLYWHQDQQRKG